MLTLTHKKLEVYKIALLLIKEVYNLTKTFPKEEQYVLVTQLRRAAISVCVISLKGLPEAQKQKGNVSTK